MDTHQEKCCEYCMFFTNIYTPPTPGNAAKHDPGCGAFYPKSVMRLLSVDGECEMFTPRAEDGLPDVLYVGKVGQEWFEVKKG